MTRNSSAEIPRSMMAKMPSEKSISKGRGSSFSLNPKVLWLALIPLVLVGLVSWGYVFFHKGGTVTLHQDKIYAVWVKELEVGPKRPDGSSWDVDGSAPDLAVAIAWEGHELLRTVVADDSILATWDPIALNVATLLKGEISRSDAQRIAKFRAKNGSEIVVGVYDHDFLDAEIIASTRVKIDQLALGLNQFSDGNRIRRLVLAVEEVDQVGTLQTDGKHLVKVKWATENPSELAGSAKRFGKKTHQRLQGLSEEIAFTVEEMGEEYQKQIQDLTLRLQTEIDAARIDVDQAAKVMEQKLQELRKSLNTKHDK